jgi:hypothetical protein
MSTQKKTHGGKLAKPAREPMLTTTVDSIPKKQRPVVTEDHPVVQKILAYVDKEIKSEPDEWQQHINYNRYLGTLPEEELVIFGIYKRLRLIPAIYEYDEKNGLSESDSNRLFNFLGSEY